MFRVDDGESTFRVDDGESTFRVYDGESTFRVDDGESTFLQNVVKFIQGYTTYPRSRGVARRRLVVRPPQAAESRGGNIDGIIHILNKKNKLGRSTNFKL
jgi:hypothetical protein